MSLRCYTVAMDGRDAGQDDDVVAWAGLADPVGSEFCVLSYRDR